MQNSSPRRALIRNALGQTMVSMAPIASGLVVLSAEEFGALALLQLFYAWAVSLVLSSVEEIAPRDPKPRHFGDMDAVVVLVAAVVATIGALVIPVSTGDWLLLPLALAVLMTAPQYFTRRYRVMRNSPAKSLLPVDLGVFFVIIASAFAAVLAGSFQLHIVLFGWAFACLLGLRLQVDNRQIEKVGGYSRRVRRWFSFRARTGRRLIVDSTLLDSSALLMPGIVAPMLGASAFGSWRSITTLSSPINVGMAVLRPRLVASADRIDRRLELALVVIGALWGCGVFFLLPVLYPWSPAISGLSGFEREVALLTSLRFISIPAYYRVRGLAGRGLVGFRMIDSAGNVILPVLGVLAGGLHGVLVGGVLGAFMSCFVWVFASMWLSRRRSSAK